MYFFIIRCLILSSSHCVSAFIRSGFPHGTFRTERVQVDRGISTYHAHAQNTVDSATQLGPFAFCKYLIYSAVICYDTGKIRCYLIEQRERL